METLGRHVVVDIYECGNKDLLNDPVRLKEIIARAAEIADATVLSIESRQFQPQGVTVYCLLEESHISIHTWPEYGAALIDAFTCGTKCKPDKAARFIVEALSGKISKYNELSRGSHIVFKLNQSKEGSQ